MREASDSSIATGLYVSGAGHGALFLWLLIGGLFVARDDIPPVSVSEVSILSEEQFAAMQPQSPETSDAPVALSAPETPDVPTPVLQNDTSPAAPETPTPVTPAQPDPQPQAPAAPPDPLPVPDIQPSELQSPGEQGGVTVVPDADTPKPEAAPRIAPEATPAPEPDVVIDDVAQSETAPSEDATQVEEAQEETAPQEATTEIVTEAETPSAAPTRSIRPGRKPPPPPTQVVEDAPQEAPSVPGLQDIINDTVADVTSEPEPTADNANPGGGTGAPITREEKGAFILAVRQCWNVGSLSSDALRVTVVVGVSLARDGKPDTGSIQLVTSDGGNGGAVDQAFEAARRAIIRCGAKGFDLPAEKYAQWQQVEITFNPENMRIK